ncbi:MAG: MFS transporter [Lewinellaceae bacterium]|nr:MFS transporter [Saprospiraceae bacterium]MCB9331429.1 MFS transporter [Lewinellaceae bacterium]
MPESSKIRLKEFPSSFWAVNTMEIFERMAWYGFFAVSSLYITGPVSEGALGFSDEDRGVLQGVVTFFLYLFPVVTGALADRYGYKRMFFAAFLVLVPAYFLLGQFKTFPTFFLAFMLVAVGAAMFKPVVVGTVSRVTSDRTASMGFGIFYMMVNIGGFLGPIVAGIVRGWDWKYVFIASSCWIAVNFIILGLFFKEPTAESQSANPRSLKKVLSDMVEVLGNGRFFLFVFGLLAFLVLGSKYTSDGSFTWNHIWMISGAWVVLNFVFDFILKSNTNADRHWLLQPMKLGDWRFGLFLLLMSGFWTCFNQIFYTLPLHIRDFTDTSDVLRSINGFLNSIGLTDFAASLNSSMKTEGQINPEYMINFNAGAIIVFQVLVSYLVTRLKPFTTIFWGTMISIVSFSVLVFGTTGWIVLAGIIIFSFGEMMASPKSKEYTGRIAPPDKVAMYMGYFYWCVALGNLFGGILSGQLYARFGVNGSQQPGTMWAIFAMLALFTALAILAYDRLVIKKVNPE